MKGAKNTNVTLVEKHLLNQVNVGDMSKPFTKVAEISNVTLVENHILQLVL